MEKSVFKIFPRSMVSMGAKELSKALGIKRLKLEGSTFKGGRKYTVINWGHSETTPEVLKCNVINHPEKIKKTVNKLKFFQLMEKAPEGPRIPEFTSDTQKALDWVKQGKVVIARTRLNGSGGAGIHFLEDIDNWVAAKLYTVYKKKKQEYRVHFILGKMVLVQQKVLRKEDDAGNPIDPKQIDFRVRNLANGFIFKRFDVQPPADVILQSEMAYTASGLDFGAVDVIYNESEKKAYVLEINTAPGLEGQTINDYARAFEAAL